MSVPDNYNPSCQYLPSVISFVDRDMFMCYLGGGIGHLDNSPCDRVDETEEPDMEIVDSEDDLDSDSDDEVGDVHQQNHDLEDVDIDMENNNSEQDEDEELSTEEPNDSDDSSASDSDHSDDQGSDDNGYASP